MTTVENKLLDGLDEGLILRFLHRESATPAELSRRLEETIGEPPGEEHLLPLLADLEMEGRIEADSQAQGQPVYTLTRAGEARLARYRSVAGRLQRATADLLGIDPSAPDEDDPPSTSNGHRETVPEEPPTRDPTPSQAPPLRADEAWVREGLDQLPVSPRIQAPYANASLDIQAGAGEWTLKVEQHSPGSYEGAGRCPLTFLYGAAVRLLYGTYSDALRPFDERDEARDRQTDSARAPSKP